MRQTSWFLLLGAVLLPLLVFAAAADNGMTSQVLTASPRQTVVAAEFDQVALRARLTNTEFGERPTDGFGTILAVAGHGTPRAHVQSYELGDALPTTMSVAEQDIAASSEELVLLGEPAVLHDLRIVALNYRPLMRDASGALHAISRIQTEVTTDGVGGQNETNDPVSFSSAFYPLYRTFVGNLDDMYPNVSLRAPGRMLVVTTTALRDTLNAVHNGVPNAAWLNWLDLKRRKGYDVEIIGMASSTTVAVSAAILAAYNDHSRPDVEYITIIGRPSDIESFSEPAPDLPSRSSVGDNLYACVSGGDLIPDLFIGRIAGRSIAEYSAYFAKVYSYETNPYTDDMRWFNSVTCVAGNFSGGGGPFPVTPVWSVDWARDRMMRDACITNADTFFTHTASEDPGHWTLPIRQDIDSGVCAVFYRGWSGSQGWQYPIFGNTQIDQLNNVRRIPAWFAIVCGSGNFDYGSGPCMGERVTTGSGSITQPKGGIIYIGASDLHTNTWDNNAILGGIVEAIMEGGVRSGGALLMAGKLEAWRQFPLERGDETSPGYYYILHTYNLLGDPETQIYFCTPGTLSVSDPGQLTFGQNLVPVTVMSNSQPVADAVVSLRSANSNAIVSTVMTDASGRAYLPANFAPGDTAAQLTVWKARNFMRLFSFPLSQAGFDPKISAVNWVNGVQPHPGWAFGYTLSVRNHGTIPVTLNATVTSLDPRISITTGTGTFGTLQPGDSGVSSQMGVFLNGGIFNGEHPRLSVVLQDGSNSITRQVEVPVVAPELVINSVRVADGNNGILEAGETNVPLFVTGTNIGGLNASDMNVTVSSWDNAISLTGNTFNWNTLNIGQTGESTEPFHASLASGVTPGRQITLRFEFRMLDSLVGVASFLLPTGLVTIHAPTGPDAYGYYAYENIDNGYAATPTYNWVELDPAHGGIGDAHALHDDDYFTMALPANFTYYGQAFGNIWVCSNGWFSFERMTLPEFRNWELPSPLGAPSLVAPFWTDLIADRTAPNDDSLQTVWTHYDQGSNRFIIEWRTFLRAGLDAPPNMDSCNFEAILEYTPSGDGSILFQYSHVTIRNRADANFFTTGWEDSYHERGMSLVFSNTYPASVDSLRDGRAIRIIRQAPDGFNGVTPVNRELPKQFALHEAYPNPFNPTTELRFDLPKAGLTTLRIYDMLGREVATLIDEQRAAGSYTVSFDAGHFSSGLYFARLTSGPHTQVRKLMLVK